MSMSKTGHYLIRNMPRGLVKAIRVAAALEDVTISKYCQKNLEAAVKRSGVVIVEDEEPKTGEV